MPSHYLFTEKSLLAINICLVLIFVLKNLKYILKASGKFILMEFYHNSFYIAQNILDIANSCFQNYLLQIYIFMINFA